MSKPTMGEILARAKVVPVITIEDAGLASDLARALIQGGLNTVEVTLRTPQGLNAIATIAREVPDCILGAGTILSATDMERASDAGAGFVVSPGATETLYRTAAKLDLPFLPGAVTASEILRGLEAGYHVFKFYPAEESGGIDFLKNIALPFPQVRFCTTGGLNAVNAAVYAKQPNVVAVGGFWMATKQMIAERRWNDIAELARNALDAVKYQC